MRTFASLLFRLYVLPAFGMFAVAFTVLGKTPLSTGGLIRVRVKAVLDNAYPVAGYALVAANFGLSMFQLTDGKTSFIDPIVTGVNQTGVLAEVVASKLLLSFPTGGGAAAPATSLPAPIITAGAVAMTSNAANGASDLTPGAGKAFVNNSDASGITVFMDAVGYPA